MQILGDYFEITYVYTNSATVRFQIWCGLGESDANVADAAEALAASDWVQANGPNPTVQSIQRFGEGRPFDL